MIDSNIDKTIADPARSAAKLRKRQAARLFAPVFALPVIVWQVAFFLAPLAFLLVLGFWTVENYRLTPAFTADNWLYVLGAEYFRDAFLRTFGFAALSAALVSALAFPVSYHLAFHLRPEARRLAILLLVTPFFTSYLVRAYTWQAFLSDEGLINTALGHAGVGPVSMLNTAFGQVLGYLTLCLPLVILLQLMSMANLDRSLIEAAENLRCPPLRRVFAVVIPGSRVGLVLGALFCFILTFGDFVSPTYLGGGNAPTLGIVIVDFTKAGNQWPRAAVVAAVMVATLLTVAFLAVRFAYKTKRSTP